LPMKRFDGMLLLLVALLSAPPAQSGSSDDAGLKATFRASNGRLINLDLRAGILVTPRTRSTRLKNCSDKDQVCLTDNNGFAFAYFRKCNNAGSDNYKTLRFPPKVVSALHNSDVWMVFDAAPKYLFHYAYSKGIVGIYLGPTASFDFRSVLRDKNFRLANLDALEYRKTTSGAVAGCSE
jgi:hypothetical protein